MYHLYTQTYHTKEESKMPYTASWKLNQMDTNTQNNPIQTF